MRTLTRTLAAALLAGASPLAAQTSLTIYQDGQILVRRTIQATVPQGSSTHLLSLGALEPGTLFFTDPGFSLAGLSYDAAVDEANTMRRAIGRRLVFDVRIRSDMTRDTVVAEVLGVNPERFRLADGQVVFSRPGVPRYPAELVLLDPSVTLSVRAAARATGLPLAWFTGGGGWEANYQVVLQPGGGGTASVQGSALLGGGQLTVEDAEVQLLAGQVRRADIRARRGVVMEAVAMAQADVAMEEGIGEAHLYTLPARVTLRPGTVTTAPLISPAEATVARRYVVRGSLPMYGPVGQGSDETQPVDVEYELPRTRGSVFGDAPLPAGTWRLYQRDRAGRVQLIGEAAGRHTAAGQPVTLQAGQAFDLTARRVQTEYATRRDSSRTRATLAYTVTVANASDSARTVDVLEERQGEWRVLDSSAPAERLSTTRTRFRILVPARGETELRYRLTVVW